MKTGESKSQMTLVPFAAPRGEVRLEATLSLPSLCSRIWDGGTQTALSMSSVELQLSFGLHSGNLKGEAPSMLGLQGKHSLSPRPHIFPSTVAGG